MRTEVTVQRCVSRGRRRKKELSGKDAVAVGYWKEVYALFFREVSEDS